MSPSSPGADRTFKGAVTTISVVEAGSVAGGDVAGGDGEGVGMAGPAVSVAVAVAGTGEAVGDETGAWAIGEAGLATGVETSTGVAATAAASLDGPLSGGGTPGGPGFGTARDQEST